jgi:O-antigen/teichoic acid export membrane protein
MQNQTLKQSGLLIGAQGTSILLSFAFTVMVTRGLNSAGYGLFRYAMTFMALAMTVLQFGWPYSTARLLALESDTRSQKEIVGAAVLLTVISTAIGCVMTLAAYKTAATFGYSLPLLLVWVSPFLYVTLGQGMLNSVCQGLNRIAVLSGQQIMPYILLLPVTAALLMLGRYSLEAAIVCYVAVFTIVLVHGFHRIGLTFENWLARAKAILKENRRTGLPIYIGGVCGVASTQVITLWVAEFVSLSRYGHFALAVTVASPMAVLVSALGTVIFRSSSSSNVLSSRMLRYSFAYGVILLAVYMIATEVLLVRAFGREFGPAVRMAQFLGIRALLVGWGDIFQRFLGAQGLGKRLGAAAVATGTVGVVSAALLLPRWEVYGAIGSAVLTGATYFTVMVALYLMHTSAAKTQAPTVVLDATAPVPPAIL